MDQASAGHRVITADGYDVKVWASVEALASFLCEPGDAENAWVEDGRIVRFAPTRAGTPIEAAVSNDFAVDDLRAALTRFLSHVGDEYGGDEGKGTDVASLHQLVDRVAAWESPAHRDRKKSVRNWIAWYLLFRRR
ncbi:MAG: hypothetical protein ACRDNK_02665 [Solirubrobacteraceae bacterium]